jgi:hypothetical protein
MDIHRNVSQLTAKGACRRPQKGPRDSGAHGVKFLNYWYNELDGTVFCLCDAPSQEAASAVHREAHGGIADEIIEVKEGE